MLGGPQTAAANFPRGSETAIEWVTPMLEFMRHKGYTRFEARAASQAAWTQAVKDSYNGLLMNKAQSWITGYNSNLDGHEYGHTRYNIFATGGASTPSISMPQRRTTTRASPSRVADSWRLL